MRSWRSEQGNVTLLMVAFCMLCLFVNLIMLDIYALLYSRRAAQTAADTAAFGAVRMIILPVSQELKMKTDDRILELFAQAEAEFSRRSARWRADRDAAMESCGDPAADPLAFYECIMAWDEQNPAPELTQVEEQHLTVHVGDPEVVGALMGNGVILPINRIITAVLKPHEKYCAVLGIQRQLEDLAQPQASLYARANKSELLDLQVPYANRPVVYVEVGRPVPSIVLGRITGKTFLAKRTAIASLNELDGISLPTSCP